MIEQFRQFFDSTYQDRSIRIVETGCTDYQTTLAIASWVCDHDDCTFDSVTLSIASMTSIHTALERENLAQYCDIHLQDSLRYLASQTWIDVAYLAGPDGLEHGREEFRLAASAGASLIIMSDFSTKAIFACREAKTLGWDVRHEGKFSILRRPQLYEL